MNQDEEEQQIEIARRCHGLDDADGIQCAHCGKTGLYQGRVVYPRGDDRLVLFDATDHKRHLCKLIAGPTE